MKVPEIYLNSPLALCYHKIACQKLLKKFSILSEGSLKIFQEDQTISRFVHLSMHLVL